VTNPLSKEATERLRYWCDVPAGADERQTLDALIADRERLLHEQADEGGGAWARARGVRLHPHGKPKGAVESPLNRSHPSRAAYQAAGQVDTTDGHLHDCTAHGCQTALGDDWLDGGGNG